MVATGTGIASKYFAALVLVMEQQTVARHVCLVTWLILEVPVTAGLLYQDFKIQATCKKKCVTAEGIHSD
jgi:hypothetical protein